MRLYTRVYFRLHRKHNVGEKHSFNIANIKQADEVYEKIGVDRDMLPEKKAHIIVIGNEKGGSGKTTTAMHVTCSLLHMGFEVGMIDLDLRQKSFTRYMENRLARAERHHVKLLMPRYARVRKSENQEVELAYKEDMEFTNTTIDRLLYVDFIVIDCPGADSPFSRAAHGRADTIITPMNDSFVDLDLLAHIDPDTDEIIEKSYYSEMVFESKLNRLKRDGHKIDWIVMRNRINPTHAKNKERIGKVLHELSKRYGFRIAPGFTERVIYRELFLSGLTLLDLNNKASGIDMNMSHLSARQEIRNLVSFLDLPFVPMHAIAAQ